MSALTARFDLYKPGGGSTGTIVPDEVADIDKINQDLDRIDSLLGLPIYTSVTRPGTPGDGEAIFESDTLKIAVYSDAMVAWRYPSVMRGTVSGYIVTTLAALDSIADAVVGDTAFMTTPGTGITSLRWEAFAGSGSTIDWRITDTVVSDTRASLDAFIAAVAAISGTDAQFKIGSLAFVTGTLTLYRFISTAGVMEISQTGVFIPNTTGSTGTSFIPDSEGWVAFTAATLIIMDGIPAESRDWELDFRVDSSSAAVIFPMILRSGAGVDETGAVYDIQVKAVTGVTETTPGQSLTQTSWPIQAASGQGIHHFVARLYRLTEAAPTDGEAIVKFTQSPMTVSAVLGIKSLLFRNSTAMTGIKITPTGGNITGRFRLRAI